VTGLAAEHRSIWTALLLASFEFAVMWIFVACGAGTIRETEGENFVGATGKADFVTFRAGNRGMATG
jgi:hypothetical protein